MLTSQISYIVLYVKTRKYEMQYRNVCILWKLWDLSKINDYNIQIKTQQVQALTKHYTKTKQQTFLVGFVLLNRQFSV